MEKYFIKQIFTFCAVIIFSFCNAQENQKKGFAISINSLTGKTTMTREEFKNATFSVHSYYPNLVGRIKLKGFTVKYPGHKGIVIEGNKLNMEAIQGLESLNIGDQIVLCDALSQPDGDYRVEVSEPMIITIK